MPKKKVLFNIDEDLDSRLKIISKQLRVSKSEVVQTLLSRFIPVLEEKKIDSLPSLMIFDTELKNFDTVGSLFHEVQK